MVVLHVETNNCNAIAKDIMETIEDRLSDEELSSDEDLADEEDSGEDASKIGRSDSPQKSGMANVISRILSKDTSKSSRLLLAKGKTNREILDDISRRRQKRGEDCDPKADAESEEIEVSKEDQRFKEEKRKLWENMGRKIPADMDIAREAKLRKIATQGMVQLFQSVHNHQKVMGQKIASVGSSERKKDKVMAEFTKGKFLDVLKSKNTSMDGSTQDSAKQGNSGGGKWKILQDDFMMGAQMKDWDKEEDDDEENQDESMIDNEMSD